MDPGGAIGWDQGGMHTGKEDAAHNKVDLFSWSIVMMKRKLYKRPSPFWQSFFEPRADRAPQELFAYPDGKWPKIIEYAKKRLFRFVVAYGGQRAYTNRLQQTIKTLGRIYKVRRQICSE